MPDIQPIAARNVDRAKWLREKAIASITELFPIETKAYTVTLSNLMIKDKTFSLSEQKKALIEGKSLMIPIFGNLTIKSNYSKKVVEKLPNFKLGEIPFLTNRLTMVLEGNDYALTNQLRLKSGIYSRRRENQVIEAFFNLAAGRNFRMTMEPKTALFFIEFDNSKIELYPLLRAFGVADGELSQAWGSQIVDMNKAKTGHKIEMAVNKFYGKVFKSTEADSLMNMREKTIKLADYFRQTKMDPEVTLSTIGKGFSKVTIPSIIETSKRVLSIYRGNEHTDDRDNLKYQTIHTIDDAIAENISKTAPELFKKIKFKLDSLPKDRTPGSTIPNNLFGGSVKKFLTTSSVAAPLPQVNPVDIMASAFEVTHMGPGGIKDIRQVRSETRQVNSSHLGVIDPIFTKENEKAGVTLYTTFNSYKDKKGNMYTVLRNVKTGREEQLSVADLEQKVIAFPEQDLSKKTKQVEVLYQGKVQNMPAGKVQYQVASANDMFSMPMNLLPFIGSMAGNRALMAAKHITHSLPLKEREAPLVQTSYPFGYNTTERRVATMISPIAQADGVVSKITDDTILIKDKNGKVYEDRYETNFPLNQKTYLHSDVTVKKGDKVKKGQFLAESIYTRGDTLALGKNLNVAYLAHKGLNSNDGMVISESASKKLTSLHMNKVQYAVDDNHSVSKTGFTTKFPNKFTLQQLQNIESTGVVKRGSVLVEGDPIVLGIEMTELSAEQSLLGKLHKKLYKPYRDDAIVWNHQFEGEVIDVYTSAKRIVVSVRSEQRAQIGDKLSQRSASKGVITAILPDSRMYRNEAGKPIDVLMSPAGIVSRQNPSQIIEVATAKVAEKLGKPIVVSNFAIKDHVKFASDLLKKHNLRDKETIFDPANNRYIKNITTGPQYILKQSTQVDKQFSARNYGKYDSNELPSSGGEDGSKRIGMLEINSLLSHNARNVLKEASHLKGTKNMDFWNAYMRGAPLPAPKTSFTYDKLLGMMTASGIKLNKEGNKMIAAPLTDNDITQMSRGEIKSPFMVRAKDLRPEKNGLFDPNITGGLSGTGWGHIQLNEPMLNPVTVKPTQTLLGLTKKGLDDALKIQGVKSIQQQLRKINVDNRIKELIVKIPSLKHGDLNKGIKELKYLKALKRNNLTPDKAYIINKVPVLPPIMRPVLKLPGSNDLQYHASNNLYSDIIHNNEAMKITKKTLADKDLGPLRMTMQKSINALAGTGESPNMKLQKKGVKGFLSSIAGETPKRGYFQAKTLTKPQDLSGRGVVIPDPRLSMDQVGLPEEMLWQQFFPFIVKRLVQKGYPALKAQEMVRDKNLAAKNELLLEIKERPVFINRAPSLHKYNIVASYAIPTERKTISVSPFIEKSQGMDYDGDTMQVHVPVGFKAVAEAKLMTPSNLLFADKTKQLLAHPEYEANYGIYKAINSKAKGSVKKFKTYEEVKNAYKRGLVTINDNIKVGK